LQSKDCTTQAFEGEKALKSFFILQLHLSLDLSLSFVKSLVKGSSKNWDHCHSERSEESEILY